MSRSRRYLFTLFLLALFLVVSVQAAEPSKEVRKAVPLPAGGRVEIDTYKGEIEVSLPKTAAFDLDADSGRRGDFRSDFEVGVRSGGRTRMALNGGGPRLFLTTHKGNLKLSARRTDVP